MVCRAGVLPRTGVAMMGSVEVTTLHPQGPGYPKLPPALDVDVSSSEDSPRVVCREGDLLWTIPMTMEPKSHSSGERLRWPRRSVMNSRLPKWIVLPGAKPTLVELLLLVMNESFSDGAIRTPRGKACCKSPFLARQLSVFFAQARYRVVKIMCSCSDVILQTMKNYKAHYSLSWSTPMLRGNSPMSSIFVTEEDEQCYNGG
jgi:hypothetical protein